jgi:phosphoserine phosphatase RsbU/P
MNSIFEKIGKSRSLQIKIGILYVILALINLLFFSVLIYENQTDLLVKNFNYQAVNFVLQVIEDLKDKTVSKENQDVLNKINDTLSFNEINTYILFTSKGDVLYEKNEKSFLSLSEEILDKAKEMSDPNSIFTSKYNLELQKSDFSITILIPMNSEQNTDRVFLYSQLSLKSIKDRLNKLYIQIGIAMIWGIFTHLGFGIIVYKFIFSRISQLQNVTIEMGKGEYSSRVNWKFEKRDEIDELGLTFNTMATKIQSTIFTISKLNDEINKELKIGKEVQELFLPQDYMYEDLKITSYYKPMREVSGDIYHYYRLENKKNSNKNYTALFFADASGHGVSAALVTTVTLLSVESIVSKNFKPNYVLQQLSNIVGNRFQSSFFATSVFFLLTDKRKIICSNAGHNAPFCFRPSTKEIFYFDTCGPPLGMIDDCDYKLVKFHAKAGDKLFIYSDGVTEAPGKDEELFSEERLMQIITDNMEKSNEDLLAIIVSELEAFSDEFRDDVSMIILEIP